MPTRRAFQWLSGGHLADEISAEGGPKIISRRHVLRSLAGLAVAGGAANVCALAGCGRPQRESDPAISHKPVSGEQLLEAIERAAFRYFWEQASPTTGQVKDRAAASGADARTLSSIAATGFGLTALCIGDSRGYQRTAQTKQRVMAALRFLLAEAPGKNGFFYHYFDVNTGERAGGSEVSPIDTSILLCGVLTCRAHFQDPQITSLATELYERVQWPWMLDGAATFAQGWSPEEGFFKLRWTTYSELMMLYLLAMGSKTHPIPASSWAAWARPKVNYQGLVYIVADAPLFADQFSHAWFDFRNKHDAFADYFENSVKATEAHKLFCLSLAKRFPDYTENLWGISSSDNASGYVAWGGPPAMGPIDGSVVPSAAGGSIAFLPEQAMAVLQNIHANFGAAWTPYGFVDAFNPLTKWYDRDVVGIGLGVTLLMAENYRKQFVWNTFMKNPEVRGAMALAGFRPDAISAPSPAKPNRVRG